MKTTLVTLTLNEIEGIKALFDKIPFKDFDEVLALDGGSTDGTVEFFKSKGITVVPQKTRGRGEAFRLAAETATGDVIVFFSPDGNEDPKDTIKLANLIKDGYDMAIASRFMKESRNEEDEDWFPVRSWANQAFTILANLFFKGRVTDSINGFRAVKKDSFKALGVNASGFAIEYQMTIRALKLKQRIIEIPTIEGNRIGGQSTAKSIPTGLKILKLLIKEIRNK